MRMNCVRFTSLLALVAVSLTAATGQAALVPVFTYDADNGTGSGTAATLAVNTVVPDQSSASNDGKVLENTVATVEDDPFAVTGELSYDFGGSVNRLRTDAAGLLSTAAIVSGGGFTMDVWIKTDGVGNGSSAKLIDYGGFDNLRVDSSGIVNFRASGVTLSSTAGSVNDSAWHHVTVEYTVTDGSNVASILGDLSITVDGTTDSVSNYGLASHPPGTYYMSMGAHPTGPWTNDNYQGLMYNPSVSLGVVPEPTGLVLSMISLLGLSLVCRRRNRRS